MSGTSEQRAPRADGHEPAETAFRSHYALLVGITDYRHQGRVEGGFREIYHAHDDAQRLQRLLVKLGYSGSQIECLRNEEATYEAIKGRLERLRQLRDRAELIVLFWAGHGASVGGRNLLLAYDANPDHLDEKSFTVNEIADRATQLNASNIALLLDTCHSAPNLNGAVHPNWAAVPAWLVDRVLLFAGASTHLASETAGGGLLTQCLEEGLQDLPSTLADEQCLVRTQALGGYLQWRLAERARNIPPYDPEGRAFPQLPFVYVRHDRNPAIGRNLRVHVAKRLDREGLPWPIDALARRAVDRCWPAP